MWDIQAYRLGDQADYVEALIAARQRAQAALQALDGNTDKICYPVRDAASFKPKVIVRRKQAITPSNSQAGMGPYGLAGDTLGAGSQQGLQGRDDTLRNSSSMQGTPTGSFSPMQSDSTGTPPASVPKSRLLSATEISTGIESDTLDRLQVVEREMWKAFKGEVAGENRPSARVKILREISEVQLRQVSVAKHVQRVERAVPAEWERIRDKVLGALGEYPEALAAVMAALEDSE